LIWQAMYQINTKLGYFETAFGENFKTGLPDLQFATFMPGRALLQKADHKHDIKNANGTFWRLAQASGTDKIDGAHNYSLLYHRHIDEPGTKLNAKGGMMLEIGLGCYIINGDKSGEATSARAGSSAQIWPRMFPNVAVHFIEIDRECVSHWQSQMKDVGVAKIHIGPQADKKVLAEVLHDASASKFYTVVDDGSHVPADIEKSFRTLMPSMKKGGLYFIEDMMFASWGLGYAQYQAPWAPSMKINSKTDRSSATPVALTAVLAAHVTGLADLPSDAAELLDNAAKAEAETNAEDLEFPIRDPDRSFFGPVTDRLDAMKNHLAHAKTKYITPILEHFAATSNDIPATLPVKSWDHPESWRNEILADSGALVDFIECSPGICVLRRA